MRLLILRDRHFSSGRKLRGGPSMAILQLHLNQSTAQGYK